MPQICDMGQTALLPLRRKACCGFFRPKNPTASVEFEPVILGTRGQHANHYITEAAKTSVDSMANFKRSKNIVCLSNSVMNIILKKNYIVP
jgi:hypothetical protein